MSKKLLLTGSINFLQTIVMIEGNFFQTSNSDANYLGPMFFPGDKYIKCFLIRFYLDATKSWQLIYIYIINVYAQ